jgi:hypothetical protein
MKTNKQWIAALCVLAMAGCASDRMGGDTANSGYSSTSGTSSTSSTGSTGSGTAAAGSASTPMTGAGAQASYGVVQAIDQMQRQDVGVGVAGAAAVGGSTGMPSDKVYRVTVRLDDGGSQMVVVDSMPSYKIGDRVRYSDGALVAY